MLTAEVTWGCDSGEIGNNTVRNFHAQPLDPRIIDAPQQKKPQQHNGQSAQHQPPKGR
jgi:hypothetical protein